ncbi:MAG: hypothetical protein SGI77_00125 [Pirellulaceae bacterium]|nr:hypothetical protein [Pirellulaceae bacterium]
MQPADLEPFELMQMVAVFFETHAIPYRVVGSLASMAFGEPRFTNDIDIAAELTMNHLPDLCRAFPAPDYYLSEPAARDAIRLKSQFNIIHPASGLKVDIFIPQDSEFARMESTRARRITSDGEYSAWFGSPEDIILNKLVYFREGGSEKHLRDIAGMMKLLQEKLDRDYIGAWSGKLGVSSEWQLAVNRLAKQA